LLIFKNSAMCIKPAQGRISRLTCDKAEIDIDKKIYGNDLQENCHKHMKQTSKKWMKTEIWYYLSYIMHV